MIENGLQTIYNLLQFLWRQLVHDKAVDVHEPKDHRAEGHAELRLVGSIDDSLALKAQ